MFSVVLHIVGSPFSVQVPSPRGPRHAGQFSAFADDDNAKAMREREVFFDGKTIVCEFHSKLTLTHDRIHFSPSLISDKNDNKFLIVGPFADHLTT